MNRTPGVFRDIEDDRMFGRFAAGTRWMTLAVLAILSACSGNTSGEGPKGNAKGVPAVPVLVGTVVQKPMSVELQAIGNVQAYSTVVVKAQIEGTLTRVSFKEGQEVREGDLLFTIDSRPFEVELKRAEADLARDKAQAGNAREQVRRYEQLLQKEFVSQEQVDQLRATAGAFEGTLLADEAAVEKARLELEYCSIRSPIDGVAGSLRVQPGNLIKANDADHPLLVINQIHPIYTAFSVPERSLSEIQRQRAGGPLSVEAIVPHGNGPAARGKLTFVDNAVNNATGTIQLKALFPNKDGGLWPGQFVKVVLTLSRQPDAIVVPSQALQTGQDGPYVFVVKPDRTVESRPVVVDRQLERETVIGSGLVVGEQVVTDGQLRLTPGATVEVKSSIASTAASDPDRTDGSAPAATESAGGGQ
jgi:membrane fusion protein, multidrug efflux system